MPPRHTPQPTRLPQLLFDPIEKHASEEFGRWASVHDWTRFSQRFVDKAVEIQSGKPGGFTLIAHNAIKLVIEPLVTGNVLTKEAQDEFRRLCDLVIAKLADVKNQNATQAAAAATKKAETEKQTTATGMIGNFAKVNATVGKIMNSIAYPAIATAMQERWQELIDETIGLKENERTDFFEVLAKMDDTKTGDSDTISERQDFIHSLLKTEGQDERLKMALAHTPPT